MMNSIFTSMLGCLLAVILVIGFYAFFWLQKRGNHDELFPIVILCLGIPPLGILILFLTFLDKYQATSTASRPRCWRRAREICS